MLKPKVQIKYGYKPHLLNTSNFENIRVLIIYTVGRVEQIAQNKNLSKICHDKFNAIKINLINPCIEQSLVYKYDEL